MSLTSGQVECVEDLEYLEEGLEEGLGRVVHVEHLEDVEDLSRKGRR